MLPKETLSELLLYLVEHEEFLSVQSLGSFTPKQAKEALKELAFVLRQEADKDQPEKLDLKKLEEISPKVRHALSTLTPRELQMLIRQFGIEG